MPLLDVSSPADLPLRCPAHPPTHTYLQFSTLLAFIYHPLLPAHNARFYTFLAFFTQGGACSCPVGKKVSNDSRSCIGNIFSIPNSFYTNHQIHLFKVVPTDDKPFPDRNECEEWNVDSCDQKCENTDGSYKVGYCSKQLWIVN